MTEQNPYPGQENAGYQAGQQQGQPAGAAPQGGPGVYEYDVFGNPLPKGSKNLAMWAHLSGLLGVVLSAGILSFLGPLIFWLVYKDRPGYGYVRLAAANAFNFNFTLWLINLVAAVFTVLTLGVGFLFTWIIFFAVWIGTIVFHIIAAIKANDGEPYKYPFSLSILK